MKLDILIKNESALRNNAKVNARKKVEHFDQNLKESYESTALMNSYLRYFLLTNGLLNFVVLSMCEYRNFKIFAPVMQIFIYFLCQVAT